MMIQFKRIIKLFAGFPVMVLLYTYTAEAQNVNTFRNLSVNEGLSQSTIFSIQQDSKGFMWFGTRGGGLNKYNGYEFMIYRSSSEDPVSLTDNTVLSILEDSRGELWVGTRNGGINRFNQITKKFINYPLEILSEVVEQETRAVRCIFEDQSGKIWIGTNHGVYLYNREEDDFEQVMSDAPFPVKGITAIAEDHEGQLYFATWDRLVRYHMESNTYASITFSIDPYVDFGGRLNPLLIDSKDRLWMGTPAGLKIINLNEEFVFSDLSEPGFAWPDAFNYVRTIVETRDGLLWFGTENGLYSFSPDNFKMEEYRTDPTHKASLSHNSVYSIFEDRVGSLWIGTWSGLSILDKRMYKFELYSHLHNDAESLSNDVVSSFQEDRTGTWIGTEQGGLNFLNRQRTKFKTYFHDDNDPESLPTNNVKTIYKDTNGDLWVGTLNGGLCLYKGKGKFDHYLQGHSVYSIIEDSSGTLYIGGITGLHCMDLSARKISRDVFPPSSGKRSMDSFVTILYRDSKNRIWIGTRYEGVYLFDPIRSNLRNFRSSPTETNSISGNYVISICEDKNSNIWIGTYNGLNLYLENTGSFEKMDGRVKLKDNVINGLLSDDEGNLWISTNTGLYYYNPLSDETRYFDYLDGLQSNEFNRGACYKNKEGELFFGGVGGFNVFHPSQIRKNPDPPPVIITDLKLFNESVVPGEKNSPLKEPITETHEIVLTHRQSSFSLEFVALNYLIPEKNMYSYILEGYEESWNEAGRDRTASYMNLEPGKYTFRVKGSNNDNVWNEEGASLGIIVKAPFWATPGAVVMYFLVLFGLLYILIRIVSFRVEKENELKLERAEKERIKELNISRLQFFTNISHEFRTPLTLIAGPLNKLISGKYENHSHYLLHLMKSNVNRMLRLVNQLMDFRKLENEKMPLKVQLKNMDKFLSQIVLGFEDLSNSKMIELRYGSDESNHSFGEQWFDEGILDKVVYNLLSNAFKCTPEQGIIEVKLICNEEFARIEVKDTGKGIDQEKVQRIFERFYTDNPELYASSGIGLSLSKRLIDLHKGRIDVESERGKGATFIVTIPVSREFYKEEEIFTGEEVIIYDRPELDYSAVTLPLEDVYKEPGNSQRVILIAEDDPEMSSYLANHFAEDKVLHGADGNAALELAKEHIPDIIISDIMMPGMDGIEFCRLIKQEFLTSHIPVILLSAKTGVDEKVRGMEATGADAYLEKPFDSDFLNVMVRNLLLQRKSLKEKYGGLIPNSEPITESLSSEQAFLMKVQQIVIDHISDASFGVDQLLQEIGMSRSQLYRKFKAISERNPSEYIRIIRLQHAASLIQNNDYTINEVAYLSGFTNVSYFNTCFKKHFGTSPGKYIHRD